MKEVELPDPEKSRLSPSVALLVGIALALFGVLVWQKFSPALMTDEDAAQMAGTGAGHDHEGEEAEEVWTCPMHPFVISDRPGACPVCGMDLVLRTSSTGLDPAELAAMGRVAVSPVERVLANVATVPVGRADLTKEVRAYGQLVYDETSYATIPAWVGGRVDRLYVEETGTQVERGQRLLSIYSPDLLAAQEEYLVILRTGAVSEGLVEPAERRLRLLGMSRRQIRRLAERGETSDTVTVYAPASGTVVERLVQEGEYVSEGQPLFRLAGLRNIWVEADVYERDVPYVSEGTQVEVELVAFPGESFSGIVTLVWPFLDEETRTTRVRVEFETVDERFRAGMYATVYFTAEMVNDALVVPTEAVIRTGERSVVYVEIDENLFERRRVQLGYRSGDLFEVRSGVEEGEQVVARGGFLIDSEAQLYAGGQSLHFGHIAEEQGTVSADMQEAFRDVRVGQYFCPTDPRQYGDEPGRCEEDNMPYVEKTASTEFDPYADPVQLVPDGAWYCPMGAEWVDDEPGRCPICGMHLVQMDHQAESQPTGDADLQGAP
jgi:Cu(I)/Ag(I) efflux system membrane fusion protein